MAKYDYTVAIDVPVRMTFTCHDLQRICEILHHEVENKVAERFFARDLHATITAALASAGQALELESKWISKHTIQHLSDGMNDAQEKADKVIAAE